MGLWHRSDGIHGLLTVDGNVKTESPCHRSIGADGDFTGRDIPAQMRGIASIDVIAALCFNQGTIYSIAWGIFLSLFEQTDDGAGAGIFPFMQYLCCDQEHGYMTVVTTGMHNAGNAGDTHPFLREILWPFLHGQGVYICPEQQRRTGPAAFQDSGDAPFFDGLKGNMPAVQLFSNICQRFCFLPGKFRVFIDNDDRISTSREIVFRRMLLYPAT